METKRLKRPKLERSRPIRTWTTLFGRPESGSSHAGGPRGSTEGQRPAASAPPWQANGPQPSGNTTMNGAQAFPLPEMSRTIADSVEAGYRVINDYIRQGQLIAQSVGAPGFGAQGSGIPGFGAQGSGARGFGAQVPGVPGFGVPGFGPGSVGNSGAAVGSADMQQLSQRLMQYGWDFASLWFEMWTKLTSATGGVVPRSEAHGSRHPRFVVYVMSERRTTATLDYPSGERSATASHNGPLAIHPLRAERQDAPPIEGVAIESPEGDDALTVRITVPPTQAAGTYNGMIIDKSSGLPCGTLSVRVYGSEEG